MERLRWIEDDVVRNAVDIFQHEVEIYVLGLLQDEPDSGCAKIEAARDEVLQRLKNLAFDFIAVEEEAKIMTGALALAEHSFARLLRFAKAFRGDKGIP